MYTQIIRILLASMSILLCATSIHAQDVESLLKQAQAYKDKLKHPIKVTGGFSTMGNYNYITGTTPRIDPFTYLISTNVNVDILGVAVPINLNFANGRTAFNYQAPSFKIPPLFLLGLSPKYKWATLHLGNRSMNFSPYTLAGHSFDGAGIELTPKKFSFNAMYGRLRRAVAEDLLNPQSIEPSYKRMGTGIKVGYKNKEDDIALILFKAWDDPNSIPNVQNNPAITPADNFVFSIVGKKQLSKVISLSTDFARSAFTRDVNAEEISSGRIFLGNLGKLFTPRASTGYHNAIKTSLTFKVKKGDIKLNHEWVDPGYRTLGGLFFNNDFQNFTVGVNTALAKKKLVLAGNGGIQTNNLRDTESNTLKRFIGSLNATYTASEKLSFNMAYSNFQNTNKIRTNNLPFLQLDSISLSQSNQSLSFGSNLTLGKEKNITYGAFFSYQNSSAIQNDVVMQDQVFESYLGNLSNTYTFPSKLAINNSLLVNYNINNIVKIFSLAPTVGISKPFLKDKIKLSSNFSYIYLSTSLSQKNTILSSQTSMQYALNKKHSIVANARFLKKVGQEVALNYPPFFEAALSVGYNFKL